MQDTVVNPISRNPFSTKFVRPGAIEFLFDNDQQIERILNLFKRAGNTGQIVGPHGAGKSTLLLALRPKLEEFAQVHWTQVPPSNDRSTFGRTNSSRCLNWPHVQSMGGMSTVWVIDGFDSLGWIVRRSIRKFCRRNRIGLLVTTHRDLKLPTLFQPTLTLESFRRLALELWKPSTVKLTEDEIRLTYLRHAPNVREALFELYDCFEQRRLRQDYASR